MTLSKSILIEESIDRLIWNFIMHLFMDILKPFSPLVGLSKIDSTTIANRMCSISTVKKVGGMLIAVILVTSTLSFLGTGGNYNAYAQDNGGNNGNNGNNNNLNVQVSEPSPVLTAQWWQWIMSIPVDENPTTDTTGEDSGTKGTLVILSF